MLAFKLHFSVFLFLFFIFWQHNFQEKICFFGSVILNACLFLFPSRTPFYLYLVLSHFWHFLWEIFQLRSLVSSQSFLHSFSWTAKRMGTKWRLCRLNYSKHIWIVYTAFLCLSKHGFFILKLSFLLPIFDFYVHLCTCLNPTHLLLCK